MNGEKVVAAESRHDDASDEDDETSPSFENDIFNATNDQLEMRWREMPGCTLQGYEERLSSNSSVQ